MSNYISLGMMSGTSIDGSVSSAIIETNGDRSVRRISTEEYCYESAEGGRAIHHLTKAAEGAYRAAKGDHRQAVTQYPAAVRAYIKETFKLDDAQVEQKYLELSNDFSHSKSRAVGMQEVIDRSTEVHIEAALRMLKKAKLTAQSVHYVGYHGQTLYHDPFFDRVTVQIGDAQALANELRIPVVYDFRSNDIKHGGQGAPLAPVYHRALVSSAGIDSAAILNLGGTANVTIVSSQSEEMLGFDTGPANGLIDRYVKEKAGIALDKDSHLASRGAVSEVAVQALLKHAIVMKDGRNYLDIQPPKSLDIRDYNFNIPEVQALSLEDGCATLNAFTAECVSLAIPWIEKAGFKTPLQWVLCGGGAFSPHLREQIKARVTARIGAEIKLVSADDVGWSAQGMEAELFAYLAVRSVKGFPITFPGTTGVSSAMRAGSVFIPQ